MRAGLYLRVSTTDQTTDNQAHELRRLAAARGWEPIEYRETGSAVKARPVLAALLDDARAGRLGAVVVWALDRMHRSMTGAIATVLELDRLGVPVVSVREPWLDTSGPVRPLLVAIFGWVAEQERTRLIERTVAGLDRARAQGIRLGRPRSSPAALQAAAELVATGTPRAAAARRHGLSARSLGRFLDELGKNPPGSTPRDP